MEDIFQEELEKKHEKIEGVQAEIEEVRYEKNGWKLKRYRWSNPSPEELDFKQGDRVWPAGENYKEYFGVKEIKPPGIKFYPDGGIICFTSTGQIRTFEVDAVIKHPGKQEEDPKPKKHKKRK